MPSLQCVRDQDATTVPTRHTWEAGSLNWAQFMLQWFTKFPDLAEITEFNESSTPFRKNSIVLTSMAVELNHGGTQCSIFTCSVLHFQFVQGRRGSYWTFYNHLKLKFKVLICQILCVCKNSKNTILFNLLHSVNFSIMTFKWKYTRK